ncbi:unnamed protein product (macronuclear) [Paramecium tetraurelia]|uniref:Uncharacterized protein n=1 Tax=Paramecium tetraurelia TaxID=5888 RepID=A0CX94_PARTE|nr:uncharacterized protein GSPATT00001615001 [Paramecium tetraurelia]CAK75411.1 unnamed protein product [Paramecium tetraurelia]|eukprot:XP_001442808.1 hypothetical protein (macronuclear) [Paramecium tetraurelia strain d4-2]
MKIWILIAGAIISYLIKVIIGFFDAFKSVPIVNTYSHCQHLSTDIFGPEDMQKFNSTTIIVGSGDYHKLWSLGKPILEQLGLYAIVDSQEQAPKVVKLGIKNFPNDISLYVHGIDIREQLDGVYIYAINHAYQNGGERVEVFKILDEHLNLEYRHSIIMDDKYNGILNDLILIEDNRFLITKYMPYTDPKEGRHQITPLHLLKTVFLWVSQQRTSYIVDCKFQKEGTIIKPNCKELLDAPLTGVVLNGITWDRKNRVWAGDTIAKQLNEYEITPSGLVFKRFIDIENSIDNLEYDVDRNSLILGLIPKLHNYFSLDAFLKGINRLEKDTKFEYWGTVAEYNLTSDKLIYLAQNTELPKGVSGALISGNNLIVASWCDFTVSVCKKQ